MPEEKPAASFESGLQELETIVKEMESGDLPLERALELFERGMLLSESCRKQLEEAETRIEMLVRKATMCSRSRSGPTKHDARRIYGAAAEGSRRARPLGAGGIRPAGIHSQGHALQPVRGRETDSSAAGMAAAEAVSDAPDGIESAACALELIHTYSLIHDDLPALDNDDLRRGRPTCHKVFGDAMAILAGDALLTLAFEVLASRVRPERRIRLMRGTGHGFGNGRRHDRRAGERYRGRGKHPTARCWTRSIAPKPERCCGPVCGWAAIYAGADEEQLSALSSFGEHVGLAFQIVDDVLDVEQSSEALGKTAGKDAEQNKITFPAVYGMERSREMAEEERLAAHLALRPLDERAERLRESGGLLIVRTARPRHRSRV